MNSWSKADCGVLALRIDSVEFIGSSRSLEWLPEFILPEVVFAGRSNVGKSSLINCLVQRKGLAQASSTPGRTRSINFYKLNDSICLVDLPGYGYSKASKAIQAQLAPLVENYLSSGRPRLCVSLVDCRRPPEESDVNLWEWLIAHGVPFIVAATKADKIKRSKHPLAIRDVTSAAEGIENSQVILFSSKTGMGRMELLKRICLDN
ncbi:MAG: YihA family ribosome biogenesis GTP-binding protein [Candidatus Coatesbacteria bacterium]|nr:YihA family ribosome biogenesis GTP-binding protein [Candidatus Coatesbacteria bacterium]